MKVKIIKNWKRSWRWFSVNCMVLAAAIQGAWAYIPQDLKQSMPDSLITAVTVGLLALGVVGRLIQQDDDV